MFYLTTHSTHFIYGYMASDIIMVNDHSDSENGNPLPPPRLLFPISSKGSFIYTIPQTGCHISRPFFTPVVEHWLEREIAQWWCNKGRCMCSPVCGLVYKNYTLLLVKRVALKLAPAGYRFYNMWPLTIVPTSCKSYLINFNHVCSYMNAVGSY